MTIRFRSLIITLCILLLGTSATTAEQQVTLNLWTWFAGPQGPLALDAMDRALRIFEAEHPNIRVNVTPRVDLDQVLTAIISGVVPDVVTLDPNMYGSLGRKGMLLDLDPLIEATPDFDMNMITPQHQQLGVVDDVRYGIAFWDSAPTYATVYNATLFQEAGLPKPDRNYVPSWNDIAEYDRKLTRRDSNGNLIQIGFHPVESWNSHTETFRTLFEIQLYRPDGSPNLYPNKPLADAITMLYETFIEPRPEVMGQPFIRSNAFHRRETAIKLWATEIINGRLQGFVGGDEIDALWAPHMEQKPSQRMRGWTLGIPQGAKHIQEAMELIKFLTTDVRALELAWKVGGYCGGGSEFLKNINQLATPLEQWFLSTIFNAENLTVQYSGPFSVNSFLDKVVENTYFGDESAENALLIAQQEALSRWMELLEE